MPDPAQEKCWTISRSRVSTIAPRPAPIPVPNTASQKRTAPLCKRVAGILVSSVWSASFDLIVNRNKVSVVEVQRQPCDFGLLCARPWVLNCFQRDESGTIGAGRPIILTDADVDWLD